MWRSPEPRFRHIWLSLSLFSPHTPIEFSISQRVCVCIYVFYYDHTPWEAAKASTWRQGGVLAEEPEAVRSLDESIIY